MNSFCTAPLRSLEENGEVELEMTGAAAAAAAKDKKKIFNGTLLLGKRTHKHRNTQKGVFLASVQCSPVCTVTCRRLLLQRGALSCSNVNMAVIVGKNSISLKQMFTRFLTPFSCSIFSACTWWVAADHHVFAGSSPVPPLLPPHSVNWQDQDRPKCFWSGVCSSFFPLFLLFFADTNNHDHNRSRWTCCYGGSEF